MGLALALLVGGSPRLAAEGTVEPVRGLIPFSGAPGPDALDRPRLDLRVLSPAEAIAGLVLPATLRSALHQGLAQAPGAAVLAWMGPEAPELEVVEDRLDVLPGRIRLSVVFRRREPGSRPEGEPEEGRWVSLRVLPVVEPVMLATVSVLDPDGTPRRRAHRVGPLGGPGDWSDDPEGAWARRAPPQPVPPEILAAFRERYEVLRPEEPELGPPVAFRVLAHGDHGAIGGKPERKVLRGDEELRREWGRLFAAVAPRPATPRLAPGAALAVAVYHGATSRERPQVLGVHQRPDGSVAVRLRNPAQSAGDPAAVGMPAPRTEGMGGAGPYLLLEVSVSPETRVAFVP